MHRKPIALALVLILGLSMPACSSFSKSSREHRKYEKYVRKSKLARDKQRSKFRAAQGKIPPAPGLSEPVETTSTGPESMSSQTPTE